MGGNLKGSKYFLSVALLALIAVCGSSSDNDQAVGGINQSGSIEWASYDSGLKKSADNGKYMLVYFWRDG